MSYPRKIWMVGKLAVTGATVAAIGFVFGVFDPDLTVQESEADILSFGRKEVTPTEKFVSSMSDLGHSKPQAFNLNGNVVYFSTRLHDEEPRKVYEQYMRKFEEKGLVPRESLHSPEDYAVMTALSGGITPMHVSDDHVFMGGMLPVRQAQTPEELEEMAENFHGEPWQFFKGFHNVDLTRSGNTTIATSSWSDENFDYEKMIPGNRALDQNVDPDVPACPGCTRVSSFDDLDPERTYRNNVFEGTSSPEHLTRFYDQALTLRGWQATEATVVMAKITQNADFEGKEAQKRQYERDGKLLTILTHPGEDGYGSVAHTVVSD